MWHGGRHKFYPLAVFLLLSPIIMQYPPTLPVQPDRILEGEEQREQVLMVHSALDGKEATYKEFASGGETVQVFLAQSPQAALAYICARTSRPRVLEAIQCLYDYPRPIREEALQHEEAVERDGSGAQPTKRKRKKERTMMQTQKALAKKWNDEIVRSIATDQEWEEAATDQVITAEELRYRNFVKSIPAIGVAMAARMISQAAAVATMDTWREWYSIRQVWRRQNRYGKKLFQGAAIVRIGPAGSQLSEARREPEEVLPPQSSAGQAITLSQETRLREVDCAGLTGSETESFKERFFDAQKTAVDGIANYLRHRWKINQLYEEYERLEREIRWRKAGTGGRGRGYQTVAKEHLFAATYRDDLGREPSKDRDIECWNTFGMYLDSGKKWNIIKHHFGTVGIFGILPRSANDFIEKRLTQTRVRQWVEMVAECNPNAERMAFAMERLFLACMEETEPPAEFAFLEDWDCLKGTKPMVFFDEEESEGDENDIVIPSADAQHTPIEEALKNDEARCL